MDDKIIVTHRGALRAKYGAAGLVQIKGAIDALVAADAKRGLSTRLVHLDDATAMKRYGARAVTDATDPKQAKDAVDAIFRKADPDYLMILGATDVVPHQDLRNPTYDPPDDPDAEAWGDLPYACDAPYSRDIEAFKGPTRVVGRLPDLDGAREPSHLLAVLGHAAGHKTRPAEEFRAYFGLSADSWKKSTALSLTNVFGEAKALTLAPPSGPRHPAKRLAPLAHFINCHGAQADPTFYGERGNAQPPSLSSTAIRGKIRPGTVATAECCYGAQLYDSVTLAIALPICQHYLLQGAAGYFGSSTIAYGPAAGNGAADLITQYFLAAVLGGASLGRAALVARQRFVQQTSELDPVDLKTLAQFSLLGDPSLVPAVVESPTGVPKGIDPAVAGKLGRSDNRAKARELGQFLDATKPTAARKAPKAPRTPTVRAALANIAREAGIAPDKDFTAFSVKRPAGGRARGAKSAGHASRYYVAVSKPGAGAAADARSVAAVAREVDGRIVGYRIYMGK